MGAPYWDDYWDVLERQVDEADRVEAERKARIAEEFIANAQAGKMYTFKFGTMDNYAVELRRDFNDYSQRFVADPTVGMIYLGKVKNRWKNGPKSVQFLATDPWGNAAVAWMDEEWLEHLCEYKRR